MTRVIIAGGTSGMGFATAKLLAQKNFEIIILGRNEEKLNQALLEIGHSAKGKCVDATNLERLKQTLADIGQVDHLVIALSGGKGIGLFRELDLDDLRKGFEGKFFPQLQTAQAVLPYITPTGSITFITSISSQSKAIGTAGLGAINGAIEIMVPTIAKELKPIRVNAVAPGVVNTTWWNFLSPEKKEDTFKKYAETIPLARVGEPEDIAKMIFAFIDNDYITGQVIAVDGGLSLGQ